MTALSLSLFLPLRVSFADAPVRVKGTIITASNNGSDYDLDNDAYRDQLIKLFSYTRYHQIDQFSTQLQKAERQKITLPGGYELVLTLLEQEGDRTLIQALIRKDGTQYVDTVLSILGAGVAFLGGPPVEEGVLIIMLEKDL